MASNETELNRGMRGYTCLLFSDICGYTELSEVCDPEDTDSFRRQLEALATRAVHAHRGTISQVYGDGILAVFGFSQPVEDDPRRAINAALDLHRLVRDASWASSLPSGFEVRMHTGVHAGLVFGRKGDALHGRYELSGDALNTTARLCSAAARDEILVSRVALRGFEEFFDTQPDRGLKLKGKASPVPACRVCGRSDVRTTYEARARRGLTSFAGRQAELDQLNHDVAGVRRGKGRLVVVTGPAGIGKSRLLDHFGRSSAVRGTRVLRGSCDSYAETAPLEPFIQILREALDVLPASPHEAAIAAVDLRLQTLGNGLARHRAVFLHLLSLLPTPAPAADALLMSSIAGALTELVGVLSDQGPLLLLLDDWHWADDSSRGVLRHVCAGFEQRTIGVFIGMRDFHDTPALRPDRTLTLQPFSASEAEEVVSALKPRMHRLGLSAGLHSHSGGNPLFLEELCRALPEDPFDGQQALERNQVPGTLQNVIQSRLSALPGSPLRTLRAASVLGIEFSASLLSAVVDAVDLDGMLDTLLEQGLLYRTGTGDGYRFKHGIAREVVYESVRISDRRALHKRAAETLEQRSAAGRAVPPEPLAYHFRNSGDQGRAAHYAELAGDKASASSSLDRASFHYAAAMLSLDQLPANNDLRRRWLTLSNKWATPCSYSPIRVQIATLRRAARCATELEDAPAQARTSHSLGWFYYVLGDFPESIESYKRGLATARAVQDTKLEAQLLATLGQAYGAAGEYDQALRLIDEGLTLKRHQASGQSKARAWSSAHALACRALIHSDRGAFRKADDDLQQALATVAGTGHAMEASVLALSCIVALRQGCWAECAEVAPRAMETAARANSTYVLAMSSIFDAHAGIMLSGDATLLARMCHDIDWLESRGQLLHLSATYGWAAEVCLLHGAVDAARDYADRALERCKVGDPLGEAAACRVRALLDVQGFDSREGWLARARAAGERRQSSRDGALADLAAAQLHASRGQGAQASARYAARARDAFTRMGMASFADHARALLGGAEPNLRPTQSKPASPLTGKF